MPRYLLPKHKSLPQTTPGQWKELTITDFTTFVNEMEVSRIPRLMLLPFLHLGQECFFLKKLLNLLII